MRKLSIYAGITYMRPDGTPLVIRTQINDELGRPLSRSQQRADNAPTHYSYQYNTRSELTGATLNSDQYGYTYDNIGNRESSQELLARTDYLTNPLNQYTSIQTGQEPDFQPEYDADGNQTVIKTKGGAIWDVEYNAENRPVKFTSRQEPPFIYYMECKYDYMGRRFKVIHYSFSGLVEETTEDRFLYRDYLLIERTGENSAQFIWDPTEPVATRPLYLIWGGGVMPYGHDFNKNVTEIFNHWTLEEDGIATTYDYTPYGACLGEGEFDIFNPFCFSSEYYEHGLDLIYYNYRHYNPADGRWTSRDRLHEVYDFNLYQFNLNEPNYLFDYFGEQSCKDYFVAEDRQGFYETSSYSFTTSKDQIERLEKAAKKAGNLKDKKGRKCYTVFIRPEPLNEEGIRALPWGCDRAILNCHSKRTDKGFVVQSNGTEIDSSDIHADVDIIGCHLAKHGIPQRYGMELVIKKIEDLKEKECCKKTEMILVVTGTR